VLAAGIAAVAAPASACVYTQAPEPVGDPSAAFIGRKMSEAAAFVDLAVAESAVEARDPAGRPVGAKAITFRVLSRIKGASAERFLLFGRAFGAVDPAAQADSLGHWLDDAGRVVPFENVREAPLSRLQAISSCDPPQLAARPGRIYLVFRGADGRLLGPARFHADGAPVRGFPFADVGLPADSAWARQVMMLAVGAEPSSVPPASAPASASERRAVFRTPLSAAAARALLERAAVVPAAVTVVRGGATGEYRPGTGQAGPGLLDAALAWAQGWGGAEEGAAGLREIARQTVEAYGVYDLSADTVKRMAAEQLLALAASAEAGSPSVAAVTFAASPAAERALAASPQVLAVEPAAVSARVRGPATAGRPLEPVEIHRRLAALSGREVGAGEVEGDWRLAQVDSYMVPAGTLELSLKGGALSGRLACAPFSGRYALKGMAIQMTAPKPSIAACPKRETDWFGDFFWRDPVSTVRGTGAALVLQSLNATYRFERR
jgi:hypothetical protein